MDIDAAPRTAGTPVCARCHFGEDAWSGPPSYAFVLGMGTDVAARRAEADAWAATHIESCATAFCRACRRVCWLARRDCAQSALLEHTALLESSAALDEHRQSQPLAGTCLSRVRGTFVATAAGPEA